MRSEENQKWKCIFWAVYCWGKSTDFSPACHECMSLCDATTCAKKPEVPHLLLIVYIYTLKLDKKSNNFFVV